MISALNLDENRIISRTITKIVEQEARKAETRWVGARMSTGFGPYSLFLAPLQLHKVDFMINQLLKDLHKLTGHKFTTHKAPSTLERISGLLWLG